VLRAELHRRYVREVDHLEHNRKAWNHQSRTGIRWCAPVDAESIRRARQGDWSIILTPKLPVPSSWLGDVRGRDVLCLAAGGGQQAPILAAAGARVTSFDLSEEQLAKDRGVAEREHIEITCVRGDMADLSCFEDASFDLVVHPSANAFVPDVRPVWRECHRVLRAGGALLAGFTNPVVFLFDHDEADASGSLVVKHALPYADTTSLDAESLRAKIDRKEPLEFSHSLDEQIGGQLEAGFVITGLYEDRWFDDTWFFSRFAPLSIATRASKPG
jgi:SAM-dependent methyltransferase